MPSFEVLATALRRFKTHPFQMALTLGGLVVGTSAIIVIVTLGLSGQAFVMSQIEGVGSHLIWATYEGTVTAGVSRTLADQIDDADARAIAARTDLFRGVTPLVELHGTVSVLSHAADLTVLGTTPSYTSVRRNVRILEGRFFDDEDVAARAKVCVVNRPLYEELFGGEAGAGETEKTIRTLGMTFRVIGEFDKPVDTMGQGEVTARSIFVPITVAWNFADGRRVDTLFAEVRDFAVIPAAVEIVEETLRERHHQGSVFKVKSMTTVVKVAKAISSGLILAFVLAAAVSVVVGGVGIMNILLASVEQRTREVGLRRSVGARRRDILRQFLIEAVVVGLLGATIGVAFGVGLPLLLRPFVKAVDIRISGLSVILAFLFSCLVTLVFGVFPAYRASTLDPTEALRHE
jgi:putative ABC transport system permease protein